ncbi:hypothetical protein [Methanotorris igneus]|uniref:Uncharacterized protein n=1 Tax=Methanotorris igneus (strain DSM 5666 / JCM 11834 / Kol 5) TaxID=880724 RepID=F6BBP3_METIK|nr:hypothetical protein [Methanotorris igneus]AEF96052.1 hypothetical protein Metig_0496 [Methanotorris igneus Kol 5]
MWFLKASKRFVLKKLKSKRGIIPAIVAGVLVGLLIGAAIDYISDGELDLDMKKDSAVVTDGKMPTDKELINDTDIESTFAMTKATSEDEVAKDLLELRQQLQTTLVAYDKQVTGSLADIRVTLKGPDKIYGPSAFPVLINIYAPCADDPSENKVHIQEVKVYVVDSNGQKWWITTWKGDKILRNSEYTWHFIVKTPDPYYGIAKSMLTTPDREKLLELLNSKLDKFELVVEVKGYREVWIWKTITHEDGTVTEVKEHVRDDPISATLTSLSAWNHENAGKYSTGGFSGSLPIKFADKREYVAYKTDVNGAVSNMIARVWATPVHVLSSSADYKVAFIANPSYFNPLNPVIADDFTAFVLRNYNGNWVVASKSSDNFGDLGNLNIFATSLQYKTDDLTTGYETYILIFANVKVNDDAGQRELPIWLIAKPAISVLTNTEVTLSDERVQEIAELLQKDEMTDEDIARIQDTLATMISSLEKKKNAALNFADKTTNEDAKDLAKKAAEYYDKSIEQLRSIEGSKDADKIKLALKLSKNYEMIGDYYYSAAQKTAWGLEEQAQLDIQNAQKIEETTKQYEPSVWFSAGSMVGSAWQSFKEGLGIGNIPDWVLILVVIILVVGGAIIVLKLF